MRSKLAAAPPPTVIALFKSERMYHALKGLGATARLVMLPEESHGYRARESLLHMLWEQNEWLKRWVSPGPVAGPGEHAATD